MNRKKLNEWAGYSVDKYWTLAFRASRDGFTAAKFHQLCDNKGETFIIIKSQNNYIFGGYSCSWTSCNNYVTDAKAFIFTIKNPHNIPPTKYLSNGSQSIYDHSTRLPTFGGGHDLYVNGATCTVNFPHSYSDTTGNGSSTFFGSTSTNILEMEIFIIKQ